MLGSNAAKPASAPAGRQVFMILVPLLFLFGFIYSVSMSREATPVLLTKERANIGTVKVETVYVTVTVTPDAAAMQNNQAGAAPPPPPAQAVNTGVAAPPPPPPPAPGTAAPPPPPPTGQAHIGNGKYVWNGVPLQVEKEDLSLCSGPQEQMSAELKTACRRKAVKDGFTHAWNGYKECAWGADELAPVHCKPVKQSFLGLGMSIIDPLDTLFIMNMRDDFKKALDWIKTDLNFDKDSWQSLFETNIRILGGLLAGYDMSGEKVLLDKAKDLGDRLVKAFSGGKDRWPLTSVNLKTGQGRTPAWTNGGVLLSEVGTLQLEFTRLSDLTGEPKYASESRRIFEKIKSMHVDIPGLYPVMIDSNNGRFRGSQITFGALGDSFYEYELKVWVYNGDRLYHDMYRESAASLTGTLLTKTPDGTFLNERNGGRIIPKMDHLACFAGGMLALGAAGFNYQRDMDAGAGIAEYCYHMYSKQPTGLAPELVRLSNNVMRNDPSAQFYILRPETVETLMYLWRTTHDQKYRDWGWEIFQALERNARVAHGYSGVRNVAQVPPMHDDKQQSFMLAETFKYLYLLFCDDDVIPLDEWVFNTEAHPVKAQKPPMQDAGETSLHKITQWKLEARAKRGNQ